MCLSEITKNYPKRDKTTGYGWKVVTINKDKNCMDFPFYGLGIKYNKWLRRKIIKLRALNHQYYDSGFHIFKTRNSARDYQTPNEKVVKVKYKGIVCSGIANCDEVLVVKQIYIEK